MLESVRIRNFRNLVDLQIEGLDRVNLFTGQNNSGKTTLLEALQECVLSVLSEALEVSATQKGMQLGCFIVSCQR